MTRIGYARISTPVQSLELQLQALEQAGCARIFTDVASGARADRPELARALDYARAGDQLVVWKLDRLGRSLPHLVRTAESLQDSGIGFMSITEGIDTDTTIGRLMFGMLAVLAEFERSLIQERVQAGIDAARANGRHGGRPRALTEEKMRIAAQMLADHRPQAEVARVLGVSRWTIRRFISETVQRYT
jgi:DNA invertase Pin-like site-specific DNA recombinase